MKRIFSISLIMLVTGWLVGWFSHDFFKAPAQQQHVSNAQTDIASPATQETSDAIMLNPSIVTSPIITDSEIPPVPLTEIALHIFRELLKQGEFSRALSAWPLESNEQARNYTFLLVNRFNQQKRIESALLLLHKYRTRFPDDIEAGLLHAKVLHQQEQFDLEAFLLIELHKQSADPGLISRINHYLSKAVQSQKRQLLQAGAFNHMLGFYRKMSNLDGANTDYQLMQAIALIEMGNTQQASTILQPLVFDSEAGKKATSLLKKIEQIHNSDYQASIPLQRFGEHFLVPLSINGKAPILLLLDTGASITLMQSPTTESPSENALNTITLQTANGKMDVPLTSSNRVNLGPFQLDQIKIALVTEPVSERAQGLLGMNILKHFEFFIDQQTPSLKLSPRSPSIHNNNL